MVDAMPEVKILPRAVCLSSCIALYSLRACLKTMTISMVQAAVFSFKLYLICCPFFDTVRLAVLLNLLKSDIDQQDRCL
jgi:hypothetical protein